MIFITSFQKMLQKGLILKIISWTDHYLKNKWKIHWINEKLIRWKNNEKFVSLRAKVYSHLIDHGSKDKKVAKDTKKCVIKRKPKFKDCKNCLKATQRNNKVKYLKKTKVDIDSLKIIIKKSKETINQY